MSFSACSYRDTSLFEAQPLARNYAGGAAHFATVGAPGWRGSDHFAHLPRVPDHQTGAGMARQGRDGLYVKMS
jgi:hypothetical protein